MVYNTYSPKSAEVFFFAVSFSSHNVGPNNEMTRSNTKRFPKRVRILRVYENVVVLTWYIYGEHLQGEMEKRTQVLLEDANILSTFLHLL